MIDTQLADPVRYEGVLLYILLATQARVYAPGCSEHARRDRPHFLLLVAVHERVGDTGADVPCRQTLVLLLGVRLRWTRRDAR